LQAIGDTLDAVFQESGTEVDQETEAEVEKAAVGQHLLGMNRVQLLDRFQFNHDAFLDDQIGPEAFVERQVFIPNGHGHLSPYSKPALKEFFLQHGFVNTLQQPRSQGHVDFHRSIDDCPGDVVDVHVPLRVSASPREISLEIS
jgi:hypothetical protein